MKPELEYIVVTHEYQFEFERIVQFYLDRGATLRGGLTVLCTPSGGREFYQSLTREKKEDDG